VEMVCGPAESAGPVVRALAAVVTRVLAVAREAVGMWWHLALAKRGPWRCARLSHSATLETVFAWAIFGVGVSGSLGGVDAGDDSRWGRGGSLFQEVGVEARADCSVSEVSLHNVFLFLRLALNGVELDPLPLHVCKARILCVKALRLNVATCTS
jgi:hypothetical protein